MRRHGFQTAVVLVGPGLKFGGALEDLTAHWTTTALDETAQIDFEGEGAGLLSVSRHDVAGMRVAFFSRCRWHVGCVLLEMPARSLLACGLLSSRDVSYIVAGRASATWSRRRSAPISPRTCLPTVSGSSILCAAAAAAESEQSHAYLRPDEREVSRHDIAGIWVAFFSRCQRYRCGQEGLAR